MHSTGLRLVVGLATALGLSACYKQVAVLPDFHNPNAVTDLKAIDARPDSDKVTEHLSLLITRCDYGVRRLGDEMTVPPRLPLLQRDLTDRLGPLVGGKTIKISRYAIYFNKSVALRDGVFAGKTGAIAAVMATMGSRCAREEMTGGWYDDSEVTTPYSPIIVDIEATFADRKYVVRSVYSAAEEFFAWGEPKAATALFEAMRKATGELAEKIRATGG